MIMDDRFVGFINPAIPVNAARTSLELNCYIPFFFPLNQTQSRIEPDKHVKNPLEVKLPRI
jgi:hypothetical protein